MIDYSPTLAASLEPKPVDDPGGKPAVHIKLASARLAQTMDRWLLADENTDNNTLDLGMAAVRLRPLPKDAPPAGATPAAASDAAKPAPGTVNEAIMVFAQKPGEQIARPVPGTAPSGAKLALTADMNQRRLAVTWRDGNATYEFDPVRRQGAGRRTGQRQRDENSDREFLAGL